MKKNCFMKNGRSNQNTMTMVNGNEGCGSKCKSLSLKEAFFKFLL
jgi:hypothetical protein